MRLTPEALAGMAVLDVIEMLLHALRSRDLIRAERLTEELRRREDFEAKQRDKSKTLQKEKASK